VVFAGGQRRQRRRHDGGIGLVDGGRRDRDRFVSRTREPDPAERRLERFVELEADLPGRRVERAAGLRIGRPAAALA
jgi:hypothetical protein